MELIDTTAQSQKIVTLLEEAHITRMNNVMLSIEMANEALELSHSIEEPSLIAQSLSKLSLYYMITGQNDLSIQSAEDAIKYFKELGDERGVADAKYSIAGTLYKTDQFYLGLVYLEECLTVYRKFEDYFNQARVQKSMGAIYEYFGDISSALQAYESCVEAGEKIKDNNLISNAYNPLSGIHLNEGRTKLALEMIEQSVKMKTATGDTRGLAFALYGRGKVFAKTEDFERAEADFNESIRIHTDMNEKLGLSMSMKKLGLLYFQQGNFELARKTANDTVDIAAKHGIRFGKVEIHHLLYEIAKAEKKPEEALQYLEEYLSEKEKIVNERSRKMIQSYEILTRMQALEVEALIQKDKNRIVEKKNQELDAFFHRVSHDLKGPISSLLSIDAIIDKSKLDEDTVRFMDMSKTQVHRINFILDELIKLTRVSHAIDDQHEIDFNKIIDECLTSFEGLQNFSQVRIERKVEENIGYKAPWILVNTILQNLIENGIKYAKVDQPHPFVNIEISSGVNSANIIVTDNGIGMSEETGNNIFEMFYRASDEVQGSGLGLYILNRAIEKLNGHVSLKSEVNKGSQFTIVLPKK